MLVDDLPDSTRLSLLRGYLDAAWKYAPQQPGDYPEISAVQITDRDAYDLGRELRATTHMVWSADGLSDNRHDCERYDAIATRVNETYGAGMVLMSTDQDRPCYALGFRGFRIVPFASETRTTRGSQGGLKAEDSSRRIDCLAAARAADERDRHTRT